METIGIIALVLLAAFLVFAALSVVATVKIVRAARRRMRRGGAQARRVVEDARLKARRYTVPGPAGELARLRVELRSSIDSTFRALDAGHEDDASVREAATLFARLSDHAASLDAELKLLEQEPDRSRVARRLPDLTDRARRITGSADALRWAAQDRARRFADDELSSLTREIDLEADALRHWDPVGPGGPADPAVGGRPAAGPGLGRGPGPSHGPGSASRPASGPGSGPLPGSGAGAGAPKWGPSAE
ncbi:hypothetical protein [Actinacidiphila sp. ITFR-21]|uniref:hypothetical protein n=1 Tax=Actinacidiphila sp. ITFR-21 TaxID=3075199 RepID=UPI002889C08F|nr:hypothetical protein [Streptomyces sp. ITFR-21]WNI15455.1 hypothetical protein RLT57_07870 [Streptomyces sp. ITFR-21]